MTFRRPSGPAAWVAVCAALLLSNSTSVAQQLPRFLPDARLAPTIRADPREPAMGGKLLLVVESATQFGTGLEGEANLGTSFPLVVLSGDSPARAVVLGLQGGVFGRFRMDNIKRDLVSTDWIFALPIFVWRGDNWFRFRYRHYSSHLGDEYIERFSEERADYTRDGLGFAAYRKIIPQLAIYGGADVAVNVDPDDAKRIALQTGLEFVETSPSGNTQTYGGIDLMLDQDSSWRPRVNLQAGVLLFPQNRRRARIVFEMLFGPSPQGEFHRIDETLLSLGMLLEL